jgi:ADP-heptose:LPS heptosyltransferase
VGVSQGTYLVVNPNASDLMVERRWPADRFVALISRLLERRELSIVLIGSPTERAYVSTLFEQVAGPGRGLVVNLAGELSLGGLFALLEKARCVVTNDTGPMHMAWALGVPTVALFGPVDPQHYGYSGPGVELHYRKVYCSPCVHEIDVPPCGGNNVCMQRIGVEEVIASIDRALTAPLRSRPMTIDETFFVDPSSRPLGLVVRGSITEAYREEAHSSLAAHPESEPRAPNPLASP